MSRARSSLSLDIMFIGVLKDGEIGLFVDLKESMNETTCKVDSVLLFSSVFTI